MSSNRSKLRRVRVLAQALAVLAVAAAGVLGAVGVPGLQPPEPAVPPVIVQPDPVDSAGTDTGDVRTVRYDTGLIAGQFSMLGNAPITPEEPQPGPSDAVVTDESSVPSGSQSNDIRYIGRFGASERPKAVLVIDDKQKLMAVGRKFEGIELVQVHDEFVIIMRGDLRERIEREGSSVDRVTKTEAPKAPTPTTKEIAEAKAIAAGDVITRGKGGAAGAAAPGMSELSQRIRARRDAAEAEENGDE